MNRCIQLFSLLVIAFASDAVEDSSPLTQTRTTLEQWFETRQLISKIRSD